MSTPKQPKTPRRQGLLAPAGELTLGRHVRQVIALCGLAFAALAAGDLVLDGDAESRELVVWAAGLGLGVGALAGVVFGTLHALLARVRGWWILWAALGALLCAFLIDDLGVMARLGGRDDMQAKLALAASVGAGLGVIVLGLVSQPRPSRPRGWLTSLRLRFRAPLLVGLVVVVVGLLWADRNIEESQYDSAHLAMRWMTLAALVVGALTLPRIPWRRLKVIPWLLGAGLAALPLVQIDQDHPAEVERMLRRPFPELATRVVRDLGDPDRDGYSALLGGTDCDPFNGEVFPGAAEIPGNGIDDNCRLGDAQAHDVDVEEIALPSEPAPMSVVLITVDTVNAMRMGLYGHKRENTPNLDRWAKGAAVFERAYTSGAWTSLALSSMFRGLYPRRLRWTRVFEAKNFDLLRRPLPDDVKIRLMFGLPIEDPRPPLAWYLQRRGMHTVAVVNDAFTEFLDARYGTDKGFDEFVDLDVLGKKWAEDGDVSDLALEALADVPSDRPFFMWVHYFGPHTPSTRHEEVKAFGRSVGDRYDHEIAYFDHEVARLLEAIDARADDRPIAVIIASDHGEVVSRKKRNHGINLTEQALRIPLLVKAPGLEPGRYWQLAGLVDVMPTILALTGTPGPKNLDGVDLREFVGAPDSHKRIMFSENWRFDREGEFTKNQVAVFDGKHKLILNLMSEATSLRKQPKENPKENLAGKLKAEALHRALDLFLEENSAVDLND